MADSSHPPQIRQKIRHGSSRERGGDLIEVGTPRTTICGQMVEDRTGGAASVGGVGQVVTEGVFDPEVGL